MKRITASTLLLCTATLFICGCTTPSADATRSAGGHFQDVADLTFLPYRGEWQENPGENQGGTLTLPNGQKFTNKMIEPEQVLTFPNGQVFKSETTKDNSQPVYVNEDGTLVVDSRSPSTQSGDLYIYVQGTDGQFTELPNCNEKVAALLEGIEGAPDVGILALRGLKDRTIYLAGQKVFRGETWTTFAVDVAPDGTLTLK